MLLIVSIFASLLILIISIYFIYGRFISNNGRSTESKHTAKKGHAELNLPTHKKSKKQKKSQKNINTEFIECKATNDDIVEEVLVSSTNNTLNQENIIEPVYDVPEEAGNSMLNSDVENTTLNNESLAVIDGLTNRIKNFEVENRKLNIELEEANEKVARYKDSAESLTEENSNIKTKLTKLERSKAKIEEQVKKEQIKAEKSHSDLLAKNAELEKNLTQNNAENVDLKRKFEVSTHQLNNTETELKSEQEKLRLLQSEKDDVIKKYEEIIEKNKIDDINHIEMYHQYESKIEQLNSDKRQMKIETVNLNNALQNKEKDIIQLKEQLKQLNISLTEKNSKLSSTLEEVSHKLSEKESHFNIDNRRLSETIESLKTDITFKEEEFTNKIRQMFNESKEKDLIFEGEKRILREEIEKLRKESSLKETEMDDKYLVQSNSLESKSDEIKNLEKLNSDLLTQINHLKTELLLKNEKYEEKDLNFRKIENKNSELQSEIERLREELDVNDKSNLKRSEHKGDELNIKLLEISNELKEKNHDLMVLQDQKMDLLKNIEQLKKENDYVINEKIIELNTTLKENEIVIKELLNEKKNLQNKFDDLKKSSMEKEIQYQNCKAIIQLEEVSKELEKKNDQLLILQNEKVMLSNSIDQLRSELREKDENSKRQMNDLKDNLERKIQELNSINDSYNSLKEKCDKLDKQLSDSIVLNAIQPQIVENNFAVQDVIQETCRKQEFQECQTLNVTNDSRAREEMQSHIDKLQSELIILQSKYYELKNVSIAHNQEVLQKTVPNINICQSDVISFPPSLINNDTDTTIDSTILTDKSQSHLDSIEKLNIEISEQRIKNQTLDKQMFNKTNEVNALKQCLFGLDGDLLSIEHLALNLQNSFSESSLEKNRLKTEYNQLLKDNEIVNAKYDTLVKELNVLKNSSQTQDNSETIKLLEDQLKKCQDDNCQLKIQLDHYRETLEKTENCLQNIQASVDQEESNWKICLKSSEQEQERLEENIRELLNQIEELRNKKHSDSSAMMEEIDERTNHIIDIACKIGTTIDHIKQATNQSIETNKKIKEHIQNIFENMILTTKTEEKAQPKDKESKLTTTINDNITIQEKLQQKINKLKQDKIKLKGIVKQLQEEHTTGPNYQLYNSQMQSDNKILEMKNDKMKTEIKKLKRDNGIIQAEYQKIIKETTQTINTLTEDIESKNKMIKKENDEKSRWQVTTDRSTVET